MAERKTREAWVGLHDPTQTKKMNKEGEFLEKCGFYSGLAWCTVLKAVDLKMLRQEFVIVAIKRQMKFTFFKRNCGAPNSKKFVNTPLWFVIHKLCSFSPRISSWRYLAGKRMESAVYC